MSDTPYPEDKGKTHYDGCWKERGHHNCAVSRIAELERQLETISNDTLEEAAGVCETAGIDTGSYEKMDYYRDCADAIRKLKR